MSQSKKALYGLVGFPVKHSLSPAMHNAAFAAAEISAEYKLFEVESGNLEDFLKQLPVSGISGCNITVPHKIKANNFIAKNGSLTEDAQAIAAVNTIVVDRSKLIGDNTDAKGFLRSIKEDLKFELQGKAVLLIGCGGAGRAIISALSRKKEGVKKIYIYDSSQKAIDSLQRHFLSLPQEWRSISEQKTEFIFDIQIVEKIKESQLLVNATPLGMKEGGPLPIDKNMLHKDLFVYDVVYNRNTELIREAKELCRAASGGLGMLLYQGVEAWELWTHQAAPVEIMRKALNEEMKNKC